MTILIVCDIISSLVDAYQWCASYFFDKRHIINRINYCSIRYNVVELICVFIHIHKEYKILRRIKDDSKNRSQVRSTVYPLENR